jgi:hypothetical protein
MRFAHDWVEGGTLTGLERGEPCEFGFAFVKRSLLASSCAQAGDTASPLHSEAAVTT